MLYFKYEVQKLKSQAAAGMAEAEYLVIQTRNLNRALTVYQEIVQRQQQQLDKVDRQTQRSNTICQNEPGIQHFDSFVLLRTSTAHRNHQTEKLY